MTLLLMPAIVLACASVLLIGRAVALPRLQSLRRLQEIGTYGFTAEDITAPPSEEENRSGLAALAERIGAPLARRMTARQQEELHKQLSAAGAYSTTVEAFAGYRLMAAIAFPVLFGWAMLTVKVAPVLVVLVAVYGAVLGWAAPRVLLKGRGRRRLDRIERQLPDLIELLVVTIEAGLGFTGSLRMATERMHGALGDELRLTMQEQALGLDISQALTNLATRADTPAMRSFVRTVDQGQSMGVSIGTIMRNLAVEMRKRRRQGVEERAQKAPVKMLFPLIFLIFPAMMLLLAYPVIYRLSETFG